MKSIARTIALLSLLAATPLPAQAPPAVLTVDLDQPGKAISPDLMGVFFEDINYAADGGLYAEMIQNRSFEYSALDNGEWTAMTSWSRAARGGAGGNLRITSAAPIHPNNPQYLVIETFTPGEGFGIANTGFDGIAVQAGETYDFSVFAKQLFTGARWGGGRLDHPGRLRVRLEREDGSALAEQEISVAGREWQRLQVALTPSAGEENARLCLLSLEVGGVAVDMVSLFPRKTFRNRPNGLRPDLAEAIAELRPKFIRFPGGCLVHGDGLGNMYRWQDTVGPVEQRRGQPNLWGYHQSVGLGYFEYFQFCEDIGAKPLPVVAAGVCCQNADHQGGTGQRGLPLEEMPAYIQEILDLIEWANGPADSKWGAIRAAAGRREPFGLQYLGIGNEDHITPVFRERFRMIHDAIRARHPEIILIGTSGPAPAGEDFENGWAFARELQLPLVDEHYYCPPTWFWENLRRYDAYDRSGPHVYVGEYAAHDEGRRTTLRSALAEAAWLTSLERNGDVVRFASFAPLLARIGRTQWNPNMIYFTNTTVVRTANHHVQALFGQNMGDRYLSSTYEDPNQVNPTDQPGAGGVFLGTWNTTAEFKDFQIEAGGRVVTSEIFQGGHARNWRVQDGTWSVAAGTYRQSSLAQPALSHLAGFEGASSYTLRLKARKIGGAEGFLIGFRAIDPSHDHWWNIGGWENSREAIEKTSSGRRQTLPGEKPIRIETNRWYDIRIEVEANHIRCFLDGELRQSFTDPGYPLRADFARSVVRDSQSGETIIKLVNDATTERNLLLRFQSRTMPAGQARITILHHPDPRTANEIDHPDRIRPQHSSLTLAPEIPQTLPPHSLTILRLPHAP